MPNTNDKSIAQEAGYIRGSMKRKGIKSIKDYNGREVPIDYVPDIDLIKHIKTTELMEKAEHLKKDLRLFKAECQEAGDGMYQRLMEENEIKETSVGGFTLATFDKEARIVFRMDSVKDKNQEEIDMAGECWKQFMKDEFPDLDPNQHFLASIVNELVFNTKDEIDTGLINILNRYGQKIENKYYQKFLGHLNQAFDLRHTKRYEVFEKKDKQGKYKGVILTYAKVDPLEKKSEK